jgi:3-hydroxyisobutyrate dehydrogenase-like beta-hydroxyacid dehydrogenase
MRRKLMRVGFLGLGQMGGPMCDHVIAAGHQVTVFDPYAPAVAPRVKAGARAASTPAEAARDAESVHIVVRDDAQAIDSITGSDGVLDGVGPATIVVLHATVAPATVRSIHAACQARGVRMVDAGISGGWMGAEAGTLYIMCGGDPADIAAVRPVLDCFGKHVTRFGDVGAGMAAKLARNLIHYDIWTGVHEGMAIAEAAGLDLKAFAHLCRESGLAAMIDLQTARDTTAPVDPAADAGATKELAKVITLGWKDLDDAFLLAEEVGCDTSIAHAARRRLGASMRLDMEPGD